MSAVAPIVGTETYISFADADALAGDRLNADDWRAAIAAHQAEHDAIEQSGAAAIAPGIPALCRRALITATATMDRLQWTGRPKTSQQPLAWPRIVTGLPDATIPVPVATACAELAFYLLSPEATQPDGVQLTMIGQSMETRFASVSDELPRHVRRLVEPYLAVRSKHSSALLF